jgi:hypothetical protein
MVNRKRLLLASFAAALVLLGRAAHADDLPPNAPPPPAASDPPTAPPTAPVPALHHAPRVTARLAEEITIDAVIDRPDQLKRALLVFHGGGTHGEVQFERSSAGKLGYVAIIPATAVRPGLAYAIELETTSGEHLPAFATRATPHPVTVLDSPADREEAALLTRLKGRRSVVHTSAEYSNFGSLTTTVPGAPASPSGAARAPQERTLRDEYYRIEGSYTYRLLGTISEFGIRVGVVRGQSVVPRSVVPGEFDPARYEVGLNYGAPRVRLRAQPWLHFEGELLTSVTEVGFSVGGGGAVLLGDAYGSKLVVGFESIQVFGSRGYSRLDLVASSRLMLSPIIEVTNMPHADRAGVRLLGEAAVDLGAGFHAEARGGYQARTFNQGGPTLGGGLGYAF